MVKTILDLTYPITSMFSGTGFNGSISNIFKDRQIEVCPLAYLTCTGCSVALVPSCFLHVHSSLGGQGTVRGDVF